MSTRGGIGYAVGDGGIRYLYQHFDSYPSGLAGKLLRRYRELDGDLAAMRKEAVDDHPGGWSVYLERCYCHGPDRDDPGEMYGECRCHSGDSSGCDPLFIEWLYVLNARGLDVYTHARAGGTTQMTGATGHTWDSPNYQHVFVGTLPWDADGEAVAAIESRGAEISEAAWEQHEEATAR